MNWITEVENNTKKVLAAAADEHMTVKVLKSSIKLSAATAQAINVSTGDKICLGFAPNGKILLYKSINEDGNKLSATNTFGGKLYIAALSKHGDEFEAAPSTEYQGALELNKINSIEA